MPKQRKAKTPPKRNRPKQRQPRAVLPPSVARIAPPPRLSPVSQPLVHRICGVTDPFCPAAKGAKWEDGNGASSFTYQLRGHFSFLSSNAGTNIIYLTATAPFGTFAAATNSVSPYTMPGVISAIPGSSPLTTYGGSYRIVSAGVIVRSVCPALTACGYIIVNRLASAPVLSATVPWGNVYAVDSATHSITAGMEVPLVFRPSGSSSRAFVPQNVAASQLTAGDWDIISIEMSGAPLSAAVIDIEFVYNIEMELLNTYASLQGAVPPSAPSNNLVRQISDNVSASLSNLAMTSVESFSRRAKTAITQRLMAAPNPVARGAGMLLQLTDG